MWLNRTCGLRGHGGGVFDFYYHRCSDKHYSRPAELWLVVIVDIQFVVWDLRSCKGNIVFQRSVRQRENEREKRWPASSDSSVPPKITPCRRPRLLKHTPLALTICLYCCRREISYNAGVDECGWGERDVTVVGKQNNVLPFFLAILLSKAILHYFLGEKIIFISQIIGFEGVFMLANHVIHCCEQPPLCVVQREKSSSLLSLVPNHKDMKWCVDHTGVQRTQSSTGLNRGCVHSGNQAFCTSSCRHREWGNERQT